MKEIIGNKNKIRWERWNKLNTLNKKEELLKFIEEENYNEFVIVTFKNESRRQTNYKRLKLISLREIAEFLILINYGTIDDLIYYSGTAGRRDVYSTEISTDESDNYIHLCLMEKDYYEYWNNL